MASNFAVMSWDGRLDNRDDLLLRLKESLRHRYEQCGARARGLGALGDRRPGSLIGDWSIVIRDRANRCIIVLASDFAGVRPLYYMLQRGNGPLVELLCSRSWMRRTSAILMSNTSAGFLMFGGCPHHTPYKGIYSRSSRSRGLRVGDRDGDSPVLGLAKRRCHPVRCEAATRSNFARLFREAVAVRLQTDSPVLAELSGGLDSSSVVCMANHLIRSGAVGASRLASVSYLWRNSLDEPFVREVESFCGIEGVHISTHDESADHRNTGGQCGCRQLLSRCTRPLRR